MTRARRSKLIVDNMPRVLKIARQVAREFAPHLDIQDFVQDGYIGLCEAARRCSRVSTFDGFSYFRIRGAMVDAHRRKAYREELNPSLESIQERLEYLPAAMTTDGAPLPDELAARGEMEAFARDAIAELPADEKYVLGQALGGVKLATIAESCERSATWTRGKLAVARSKVAAAVALKAA